MLETEISRGLFEQGVLGIMLLICIIFIFYMYKELNTRHEQTVHLVEKNTASFSDLKHTIDHLSEFLRGKSDP